MAGYARFRRARKSFGSRRGMRRSGGSRGSRHGYKKTGYRKPRFATVGFARNVEKKYHDKTFQGSQREVQTGGNVGVKSNGITYVSDTWGTYSFGIVNTGATSTSNDMLKGLGTGTNVRSRIGHKIRVKYVKGAFTFTAAVLGDGTGLARSQGGEALAHTFTGTAAQNYLRTTYRMVIVKDMQVNSTDTQLTWAQVFDTNTVWAGVHSELNVDNMGRFIILDEKVFTLDADTPQKTCTFNIRGSTIGNVRYASGATDTLTDKGIYVIWAAFVMGVTNQMALADIDCPSPVGHSRLCQCHSRCHPHHEC